MPYYKTFLSKSQTQLHIKNNRGNRAQHFPPSKTSKITLSVFKSVKNIALTLIYVSNKNIIQSQIRDHTINSNLRPTRSMVRYAYCIKCLEKKQYFFSFFTEKNWSFELAQPAPKVNSFLWLILHFILLKLIPHCQTLPISSLTTSNINTKNSQLGYQRPPSN